MFEIKKLENSLVEIKGEIETEAFEKSRDEAIKRLGENLSIDGFRKGHVPANVLENNLGSMAILEEMAQITLSKAYGQILKDNNIDAIGYPKINITKLAKDNPLGFTIVVATLPEIKLPDYKKIASKVNKEKELSEISDKEFDAAIDQVRTMRAKEEAKGAEVPKDAPLPELDDAFVKKLGSFESVSDFKEKVRANMNKDKKARADEKNRLKIIDAIIAESGFVVPAVLIEAEIHKIKSKLRADIEGMGLKYEDYLTHIKKTEEDLQKDWQSDAEKRAKMQLLVLEIAKAEKITVPKEKIEEEVKKVTELYKDADPESARHYIESVLINEEVFKFLESQN